MRIALRYVAAPVLAAGIAVTIVATTASATNSPNPGGDYCGQFCGAYHDYSNTPDEAAAPASYRVRMPSDDPLSPVWIQLPIVDAARIPVPPH
jgi:hypothetical protein